jgi:8-oxo-dGTP pyrophosphatase MutT (NUDIX family)
MKPTSGFTIEPLRLALAGCTADDRVPDGLRPAGVLVPLYRRRGEWHVLLCRRSDQLAEHQGEMAFPGGRLEESDSDLLQCALREAWEEVGVRPEDVTVLGPLDPVITRTGYRVSPTVATLPDAYSFTPSEREVAELVEVPMEWLLQEQALRHEARLKPNGALEHRYAYAFESHLVFGATALILDQLLGLCVQAMEETSSMEASR